LLSFCQPSSALALDSELRGRRENEGDVPFDSKHIRVIYYNVSDPFWGEKQIENVAETILSALNRSS
jgi:hypothetical protein